MERLIHAKKGVTFDDIKKHRVEKESPVLNGFFAWLDEQTALRGSRLEKALNYIRNRKPYLTNYLLDGGCSFHNNTSERSCKPFTIWAISSSLIVIFNILLDILIIKTMRTTKRLFNHFSPPSFYYQSNSFTFICGSTLPPQESSYRPIQLRLFSHFSFYNSPTSVLI